MPAPLFADTGALFALFNPRDERHEDARTTLQAVQRERRPLLTSTGVFNELVTLLRSRTTADHAVRIGETLRNEETIEILSLSAEIHEKAWDIFKSRRWPGLSFTDCTSSALMTTRRIREVFTFDADFRKLGHATLPAPKPLLTPRRPAASPSRRPAPGTRPPTA